MDLRSFAIDIQDGISFCIRIIQPGDAYGEWIKDEQKWSLVFDKDRPQIEFFDSRYPYTPLGQFVARYFVDDVAECVFNKTGLILDDPTMDWRLDASDVRMIGYFIDSIFNHDHIEMNPSSYIELERPKF